LSGSVLWSLDDYLRVVEPHLPSALVSPEGFARLRALAAQLPPQSMVGFECLLADQTQDADLAVGLPAKSPGMKQFSDRGLQNALLADLLAHPIWQRVSTLCMHVSEPHSVLHDRLGTVWLEFDGHHQGPGVPVPNVLFGLPFEDHVGEAGPWQVAESALELLTGESPPRRVRDMLERCFTALPSGAHLFQLGVMLGRRVKGVRVCVCNLSLDGIGEYLDRLGWTGRREELIGALSPLTGQALRLALGIDVGDMIAPRIGVECYLHDGPRTRIEGHWAELLDLLVARGMCRLDKRDALLCWPGQTLARFLWPVIIARGLNHIKLVYQPGCPPQAKAYFGFACVT
jgi:hypothetical protein